MPPCPALSPTYFLQHNSYTFYKQHTCFSLPEVVLGLIKGGLLGSQLPLKVLPEVGYHNSHALPTGIYINLKYTNNEYLKFKSTLSHKHLEKSVL